VMKITSIDRIPTKIDFPKKEFFFFPEKLLQATS